MKQIFLILIQIFIVCCMMSAPTLHAEDEPIIKIYELNWTDRNFLKKQKTLIDELGRSHFGTPVRGNITDLVLLQRIINKGLIKSSDIPKLQALGAVLGDVFISEYDLNWRIYEDDVGRSRAICLEDSEYCLFPITMLSRRMQVGLIPDVKKVYRKAIDAISPYLPSKPFSVN